MNHDTEDKKMICALTSDEQTESAESAAWTPRDDAAARCLEANP